jgi:hypothetical protein
MDNLDESQEALPKGIISPIAREVLEEMATVKPLEIISEADLEKLKKSWSDRINNLSEILKGIGENPLRESPGDEYLHRIDMLPPPCQHEYKEYVGLTERFEYCAKCDARR